MTSTYVADRARDLIDAGMVRIIDEASDRVVARVAGYQVRLRGGRYTCDCPAGWYRSECSHAVAVALVLEERP